MSLLSEAKIQRSLVFLAFWVLARNISFTEKLEGGREQHERQKLGCKGNWNLPLATSQIDNEMIGWDSCMGPNLGGCSKGANQNWAQLESSTRLMMDSGRTMVRCSLKHA